jgi:hypothetical protein
MRAERNAYKLEPVKTGVRKGRQAYATYYT